MKYQTIVTIDTDTLDHAREVITERVGYEEDYGFDYTIDCTDPRAPDEEPSVASLESRYG